MKHRAFAILALLVLPSVALALVLRDPVPGPEPVTHVVTVFVVKTAVKPPPAQIVVEPTVIAVPRAPKPVSVKTCTVRQMERFANAGTVRVCDTNPAKTEPRPTTLL